MEKVVPILIYLFLQWLYLPLNRRPVKYYWKTNLDDKIPLVQGMIVVYSSYFLLFFGGSFRLIFSDQFWPFIRAMIIAQSLGDLFWWLWPNGVKRPEIAGEGVIREWLKKLYRFDQYDGNAAPSAHVFHALVIGYFSSRLWTDWGLLIYGWVALIIASTVLIKQHYLVDILGGMLVAAIALSV